MILYAKIRRMYFRDKLSINEIVRRTSLSRNTVKKWLRMPNGSEPAYQRRVMPAKLTPFEDQLNLKTAVEQKHKICKACIY
jgi:hypothetical protein